MWNRKHPIAPGFDWRLKVALDRITPPAGLPRYAMASAPFKPWRLAPIALAGAATVLLALTAFAATGSANPVVWSERATSTIQSAEHGPEASPSAAPSRQEAPRPVAPAPRPAPAPKPAPPRPAPTQHPEESPQPTPWDQHHGSSWAAPSPKPSPTPDEG